MSSLRNIQRRKRRRRMTMPGGGRLHWMRWCWRRLTWRLACRQSKIMGLGWIRITGSGPTCLKGLAQHSHQLWTNLQDSIANILRCLTRAPLTMLFTVKREWCSPKTKRWDSTLICFNISTFLFRTWGRFVRKYQIQWWKAYYAQLDIIL